LNEKSAVDLTPEYKKWGTAPDFSPVEGGGEDITLNIRAEEKNKM